MTSPIYPPSTLTELETKLAASHSDEAVCEIQAFSLALKNTQARLEVFNADGAILRDPINSEDTSALGFDLPEDAFSLLQGDIVMTEAAFFLGERVTGLPRYIVLNSSCDLVKDRRKHAALLRVAQIRQGEQDSGAKLNLLLQFKRINAMYLPVLETDTTDVLCNVIEFDGICQIRSDDLMLAGRIASLSLVGWRIFASFSKTVLARANPRETQMRIAVENQTGGPATTF